MREELASSTVKLGEALKQFEEAQGLLLEKSRVEISLKEQMEEKGARLGEFEGGYVAGCALRVACSLLSRLVGYVKALVLPG